MRIADAHCDALMVITRSGLSAPRTVTHEALRVGRVGLQLFALYCGGRNASRDASPYDQACDQLRAYREMIDEASGYLVPTVLPEFPEDGAGAMLSMEDCEALDGSLERLREFYEAGVRVFGLTWNHENQLGDSAVRDGGGLKPFGRKAVAEMARLGAAVDASHLSEKGFWDILDLGIAPCCTHSNAKALCPHPRNLTDEQLRALFAAGGFVGVNFYPPFLCQGEATSGNVAGNAAGIADVVRHIEHMLALGGGEHIGFGSDFDGIEMAPRGLAGPRDFPSLIEALTDSGLSAEQIEAIASGNLLGFLRRTMRHA